MLLLAVKGESLPIVGILYMVAIALITYFLLVRPAKKRQAEFEQMLDNLKVGDEIITKSGVRGVVISLNDPYFILETANGTQIEYILNALNYIVTPLDENLMPKSDATMEDNPHENHSEEGNSNSEDN